MTDNSPSVADVIADELQQAVPEAVTRTAEALLRKHPKAVVAILFLGSCLRDMSPDGVIDYYVLVETYREFHPDRVSAYLNALLPPSVYYIEVPYGDKRLRAKYAVVSLRTFLDGTSARAFQPYLWGRFAQPCALIQARDAEIRRVVAGALVGAVERMISETLPLLPSPFSPRQLWTRAFAESYRTEWRAERARHAEILFSSYAERYERLTAKAESTRPFRSHDRPPGDENPIHHEPTRWRRLATRARWWARRLLGKCLHVFRLAKSAYTFSGGLDYILWKIERHSGVRTSVTPWQRRHPLVAAPVLAWRLYHRGAFR